MTDPQDSNKASNMSTSAGPQRELQYSQAIDLAVREEMRRDSSVFVMGQGLSSFRATGLVEEFGPKRVRDTAITETFMAGAAAGAALVGLKPVVQMGFGGVALIAGDEIYNKLGKWRYMHGGQFPMSAVLRLSIGHTEGAGGEHSNSYEVLGMHFPGLKVAIPATPSDAYGLMKTAIREPNPVLFHEVRSLMDLRGPVPEEPDFAVPLGEANLLRSGDAVTVVTYGQMVHECLTAANMLDEEGVSLEVIDLRGLVPLDITVIVKSVAKTRRAMVVNEAHLTAGPAAEIASRIYESAFGELVSPVQRVCALDVPAPQTRRLEAMVKPSVEEVAAAARQLVAG